MAMELAEDGDEHGDGDRLPRDPTPEQIAAECRRIREGWPAKELRRRQRRDDTGRNRERVEREMAKSPAE